jgi:hypothetical protein
MSDDDFMALPPFETDKAMEQLRRSLRDMKLAPRGNGFEWKASPVIELEASGTPGPPADTGAGMGSLHDR